MKLDFGEAGSGGSAKYFSPSTLHARVVGETDRQTDVILCPPDHLAPVPCCAVTRQNIEKGFQTCRHEARAQHAALVTLLGARGVRCHTLSPRPDQPDMCFTRDIAVATPFGLFALNPAMPHRRGEVDALVEACAQWRLPISRITSGTIEGGDVCVAREGLLILGMSGERSSRAGIEELATPFRAAGWDVLICPFNADHLHLDTIFCMVSGKEAIACVGLLDTAFVEAVSERGIKILPVPAQSAASLGCNILALGDRRIIASQGDNAVVAILREANYRVDTLDISQFAACGGGIHCLTQPIRRVPE